MTTAEPPRDDSHSKALLADRLAKIEGWTYLAEVWALHEAVRSFPGSGSLTVVEIGSWHGRSTVALALGVRSRGSGVVYAIDPHTGNKEYVDAHGPVDTFGLFQENINKAGVADLIKPIRQTSHEACRLFGVDSVHVLFVDGSHEYADVHSDIEDWTPILADGGVVAFNDPLSPGVNRALRELVLIKGSSYRSGRYVANTLFLRIDRRARWRVPDSISLLRLRVLMALRSGAQGPAAHAPAWAVRLGKRIFDHMSI